MSDKAKSGSTSASINWDGFVLYSLSDLDIAPLPETGAIMAVCADIHSAKATTLFDMGWLSEAEQTRANRFAFDTDRACYMLGRAIVRSVIARARGCQPKDIDIAIDAAKKPYMAQRDIAFSITHSGRFVAVAFTRDTEIGCDLELGEKLRNEKLAGIAGKVFTKREQNRLHSLQTQDPKQARAFFLDLWQRKEALLKAAGTGLAGGAATIEMLDQKNCPLAMLEWSARHWKVEILSAPALPDLAVATQQIS